MRLSLRLLVVALVGSGCGSAAVEETSPSVAPIPTPPALTASASASASEATLTASAAPSATLEPPKLPPIDIKLTELHGVVTGIKIPTLTGEELVLESGQRALLGFHGPITEMEGKKVMVTGEFKFLHGRVTERPVFEVQTMKLEDEDPTAQVLEIGAEETIVGTFTKVKQPLQVKPKPDSWTLVTAKGSFSLPYVTSEPPLNQMLRVTVRRLKLSTTTWVPPGKNPVALTGILEPVGAAVSPTH